MRRLNVGSGWLPKLKYINLDIVVWPAGTDVQADGRRLPFRDQTFDHIYSRATLDHFPSWDIMCALHEMFRVLSVGGHVAVIITDLELVFRRWFVDETIDETYALALIYGGCKTADSRYVEFQDHTTGFTEARLRRLMEEVGFVKVTRAHVWTTPMLEMRGRRLS